MLWAGRQKSGFDSRQGKEIFLFSIRFRAHSVPEVKQQGSEADHSPPSSAAVKNDGAIPPLSHTSSCVLLN
jgi:hypothetical protein